MPFLEEHVKTGKVKMTAFRGKSRRRQGSSGVGYFVGFKLVIL